MRSQRKSINLASNNMIPSTQRLSKRLSLVKKNEIDEVIKEVVFELKPSEKEIKSSESIQSSISSKS